MNLKQRKAIWQSLGFFIGSIILFLLCWMVCLAFLYMIAERFGLWYVDIPFIAGFVMVALFFSYVRWDVFLGHSVVIEQRI